MQRWAVKRATLITAVSRYTRHQFLRHCDVDPIRVRVLPNTFDSRYTPGQKPEYLLDRYSLHGRKILLTVGRLADDECDKGHDRIIKALPTLIATRPDLTYVIVGTGNDRARLEALTDELKLGDHVLFVGMADPQQLPDYYRLADVFAMPSVQEGFGIVFLEAAASGLKLVGGNTDGSVDALADGAFGFSIDPLAPDQLVQAITEVLAGGGPDSSQVHRFSTDHFVRHVCGLTSGYFHGPASAHLP
jgi:glycosyltransferase involved in cell wall biosynthesis